MSSKQCSISESNIDIEEFESQLSSFKEGFRLEMGKRKKQKGQAKLILERGKDAIKNDQNKWKSRSEARIKETRGEETFKKNQNERKAISGAKIKQERGEETVKKDQNES